MTKSFSKFLTAAALIAIAMGAYAPLDRAQSLILTRVSSVPDGPEFYVDGGVYAHAMSAFWPAGSVHSLWVPQGVGFSYNADRTIQYTFIGWSSGSTALPGNPVSVTADSSATQFQANFSVAYKFGVQFVCSGAASCSAAPGTVTGYAATLDSESTWQPPETVFTLQAFPNPGWIFVGWQAGPNQVVSGFTDVVTLRSPVMAYAVFAQTKTINFDTTPSNLKLYADGVLLEMPASLSWGLGTVHRIAAIPSQMDNLFHPWVFANWSDGGALSHTYTVGSANIVPETIVANYVPGTTVTFTTLPGGLNLAVDGLNLPQPYSYIWGVGETHQVVAPLQQSDTQGSVWTFSKWDDGTASNTRSLTVPNSPLAGVRWVALYTGQSHLTVNSSVPGLSVTVDGTTCATPCTVVRPVGTQVHVSAPASLAIADGSRQDFLGWSVGGAAPAPGDWAGVLNDTATTINAVYHLMNRLTVASNPSDSARWSILPQSPDGFYDSQTQVGIGVAAQPGYRFAVWNGDLSGTAPSGTLTMNAPHSVTAQFSRAPYIAPGGVQNGAGVTPQAAVAPGSVASIYGAGLASTTEVGSGSPLAQTLAGVTVRIGTRLLPLFFASPTQINLQVPPDLAPGTQTITVSSQGMPDVSSDFTIAQDAPGLFPMVIGSQSYALVLHEDGSLVTPDAPAKIGELLTVYGTGFGPTANPRPEGLAVPPSPPFPVVDPVGVLAGDSVIAPENVFAVPGSVAVDAVQFRLDSSVPSGANANLHVKINGVDSNALLLPVQ